MEQVVLGASLAEGGRALRWLANEAVELCLSGKASLC